MYIMKEDIWMANKCRERCSSRASVIKEMHIKITTEDLHMQVRMTTIKETAMLSFGKSVPTLMMAARNVKWYNHFGKLIVS